MFIAYAIIIIGLIALGTVLLGWRPSVNEKTARVTVRRRKGN